MEWTGGGGDDDERVLPLQEEEEARKLWPSTLSLPAAGREREREREKERPPGRVDRDSPAVLQFGSE